MADAELIGVTKRFGETVAVDNVSLSVRDGEFVVLLGPTGAGKTTLLRLFAGLEEADHGTVRIAGHDVTDEPPAARDVAFVFQQYSLYPHYSVFDNLAFPLRAPGRKRPESEIKKRVTEIAQMLRIGAKLKNRATQLSGGEMQRVSIGRALVRSPNLFLMDEPLSSLDAKLREELRAELKRIQQELGATVIYVTHDQLEAMGLADRIGILSEGKLVQLAGPRTIYEEPVSVTAAQRLGNPAINLLRPGDMGLPDGPMGAARAGVRPEDVRVGTVGGIPAKVINIEHLGADMVALMEVGDQTIHALLTTDQAIHEGDGTTVTVRPGAPIWFDQHDNRIH
ncbi:MAG: ABC transporter ATP-binding protein [Pseudomonadota bacterium]